MKNFSKPGNAANRNAPHSTLHHDERCNITALRLIHNRPRTGRLRECLAQVHYVAAADRSGIRRLWVSRELEPLSTAANDLSLFFTLTTFHLPGHWTKPTPVFYS